uniref:Uncharacterized protein n=1 Tax=Anguilla anguilla TaxID=7936 RepID=A0A0E9QUY4_ANGAN
MSKGQYPMMLGCRFSFPGADTAPFSLFSSLCVSVLPYL